MSLRVTTLAAMCCLSSLAAGAAQVVIEDDGMLNADGKRVFVLGLYENPGEDAVLDEVAAAGFNLVYAGDAVAALDRLQSRGLWAWVNTGARIDLSEDRANREAALAQMAATLAPHPALLVWEVPDEALWNCWYGPQQWRFSAEPKQQGDAIATLTDPVLAESLQKQREEVRALQRANDYAASEAAADAIWRALGKEPPQAGGLSTSAANAAKMCQGMREGYARLRALDPNHPVWMNHAPRNSVRQLLAFGEAADIAGCDIYPVPEHPSVGHSDLANRTISSVGAYTDRMQAGVPGKPVWMVLQGMGWGDIQPERDEKTRAEMRRPTLDETRFMAYDTIVHRARGILYWGTAYIEKDSAFWKDLLCVISELRDLQPVLAAKEAPVNVSVDITDAMGSFDRGVLVLPKAAPDGTWLLLVNEWPGLLDCTLGGLESLEGVTFTDKASGVSGTVSGGRLPWRMNGYGVAVLQPGK